MELSKQVTSLELSKKLKELGVPQNSYFEWSTTQDGYSNVNLGEALKPEHRNYNSPFYQTFSAFTVAELGEILPEMLSPETGTELETYLEIYPARLKKLWSVQYKTLRNRVRCGTVEKTMTDAMASMLIYLLENNLLKTSELTHE